MDIDRLMAIVAMQRTGSHMLGDALGSHPKMKYTGEIFCRRVPRDHATMVQGIKRVQGGGFPVIVLDLKYNQLSDPVFALLPQIRVIHLLRKNMLACYFSGLLHDHWNRNVMAREGRHVPRFRFEPSQYRALVRRHQHGINRVANVGLEYLRLTYEDLTGGQSIKVLPEWASYGLCNFAKVEERPLVIRRRKAAPVDVLAHLEGVPEKVLQSYRRESLSIHRKGGGT